MNREEEIRTCIGGIDSEILKDALSIVLAEHADKRMDSAMQQALPDFANFAQAVLYLKKKYHFQELDAFSTEADLVYVQAGDRRVLLTDRDRIQPVPQGKNFTASHDGTDWTAGGTVPKGDTGISGNTEDMDNAFEPLKKDTSRFSHLEL
jgi:hypothetical protein